jgi:hypothetical protein
VTQEGEFPESPRRKFERMVLEAISGVPEEVVKRLVEDQVLIRRRLKEMFTEDTANIVYNAEGDPIPTRISAPIQVWREVTIGVYKSAEAYLRVAEKKKLKIMTGNKRGSKTVNTKDVVKRVAFSSFERKVLLVKMNIAQLGYDGWAKKEELLERFKPTGLVKCPPEAALMLFLEYHDQSTDEFLSVVMDYLTTTHSPKSKSRLHEFHLIRNSFGRYLTASSQYAGGTAYDKQRQILLAYEPTG